ncbi:right-handed parallel beta-helix repeat-containing protein [Spirosoma aerophilum]
MKQLLFIVCLLVVGGIARAQSQTDCQCDYVINKSGNYDNAILKIKPGQTVCIQNGYYDNLRFSRFVGTPDLPIRFINCGGQVLIGSDNAATALDFQNCSYFVCSGSGDASLRYGFFLNKNNTSSAMGVSVSGFSSNYEIERLEITGITYAGFFCKLDPGCDPTSWRGNYAIQNVSIHDNYLHDINGLGMFLGSGYSASNGTTVICNGISQIAYPVEMLDLQVYNNRVDRTASAGIQISNAPGSRVYNNTLTNNDLGSRSNGLQKGGSDCGCDYTMTKADSYNNAWFGVEPGKTVCIRAGHYNYLRLANFVGAPGRPIRFINCGGQVTVGSTLGGSGITVSNSRYFAISGTGDTSNHAYGINFTQSNSSSGNSMGLTVGGLSSDCEIDHIEVGAAGFAGIMVKTDPSCDSSTWRSNFTMYNVKVHDNYIHDTSGEGLYIGNSFYGEGMAVNCNGVQKQVLPHLIYGLEIYNNRTLRTGCEGIQYSCAPDAQVHDNFIQTTGVSPFAAYQNNGLQISGGAGGDCYNNTIIDAPGIGLAVIGHLGGNRIFNNVISGSGADGIFCDDRPGSLSGTSVEIANNTINNCGRDGIRLYNEINNNLVVNNAITGYGMRTGIAGINGKPMVFEQGATAIQITNFSARLAQAAGYKNAAQNDFTLQIKSPLIGAGIPARRWGVLTDRAGKGRPVDGFYTVGAYEFASPFQTGSSPVKTPASVIDKEPVVTQISIYPVPFTDWVTIQLPTSPVVQKFVIYSVTGQMMGGWSPDQAGQTTIDIPTANWPAGVYTYQTQTEQGVSVGRLVKQ